MAKQASRTKNSILNLTTGFGGALLSTVLEFVVRTVFIHTLGKSYLGINGLFSDILTMLSLTELGFGTAIVFKLYKPLAEKDEKRVRVLMKFYKQAYRVVGTVILLLGICFIPALPLLIRDYDRLEVLGVNAALIFMLHVGKTVCTYWFFAYRSEVMRANQKKYILDTAEYGITILNSIAKILVLVYLHDFVLYTATFIFFNILKNFVNAVIAKRYYPQFFEREEESLSREEVLGLIKDCGALFAYKVNGVVLKATDNMVISAFIGLAAVGLYSNYLLFFATVKSLLNRLYSAVRASMGNLFATGSLARKYMFFQIMNYLTVVLYGTAAAGIAVCANETIQVWVGSDFVVPQPFPILIGIETLFHGLQHNLGQIRNVSGVFRQMWFRPILGIIINLGVSVALVQICGIYGVILGTIIAVLLTNFLVDPRVIHKYSFKNHKPASEYYRKNLLYFLVLFGVTAFDMWLCSWLLIGHGWYSVIIHALIVSITVPGTLILVYWNSHECRYLRKLLLRILQSLRNRVLPKKRA